MIKAIIVAILLSVPSLATTRYVAQSAGTFSGGTACNGQTAITPTTWNATAEVAGDISYVCGTISFTVNTTGLTFGWSGSSGNPIILFFDTGAVLQDTHFTVAITGSSKSFITIDGQNTGTIENTLTGSSNATCLAGACTITTSGNPLIQFTGGSDIIIKNVSFLGAFVHEPTAGTGADPGNSDLATIAICSGACGAGGGGSNITIDHNTFADTATALFYTGNNTSNVTFSNNTISRANNATTLGQGGGQSGVSFSGWYVFGNTMTSSRNWDDCASGNASICATYNFHHDGIGHIYLTTTNQTLTNCFVYRNKFTGDFGNGTALMYLETYTTGSTSTCYYFNNILFLTSALGNGFAGIDIQADGVGHPTAFIYNNTVIDTGNGAGTCFQKEGNNVTMTLNNNICSNVGAGFFFNGSAQAPTADHNDWNTFTNNGLAFGSNTYSTFAAWQTAGFDANGSGTAPNLNAGTFVPNAGSPAIGLGVNLYITASCASPTLPGLGGLCTDYNGAARPASAAWDAGAFQVSNQTPAPALGMFAELKWRAAVGTRNY